MKVLLIKITLRASWVHSFKEKRMIWLSIAKRLKNNFDVSVNEVEELDKHHNIVLGIASVGNTVHSLKELKEKILDFVEDNTDAELIGIEEDIIDF